MKRMSMGLMTLALSAGLALSGCGKDEKKPEPAAKEKAAATDGGKKEEKKAAAPDDGADDDSIPTEEDFEDEAGATINEDSLEAELGKMEGELKDDKD